MTCAQFTYRINSINLEKKIKCTKLKLLLSNIETLSWYKKVMKNN